jgi:hypothetical protein
LRAASINSARLRAASLLSNAADTGNSPTPAL